LVAGAIGFTMAASGVAAQSDPRLTAAVQLAQDGLSDSARAVVSRLLTATPPSDSSYPEILYTSGLVAATEYDRRIALRRVIVEYSTSGWADDALMLMGQVEYANGNPGLAVAQFSRLISDYPTSSLIPQAAFWGARAASDLRNGAEACRLAGIGLAAGGDDLELKNQLEYQRQRCSAILAQAADTGKGKPDTTEARPAQPPAPPPSPAPAPPPVRGGFRVQVIAAPTEAKAGESIASLKAIGYQSIVVREGGFFKVRAGPFASRAEANAALSRIRTRLGGQPFVVADR
jgi:hypothetical protein